MMTKEASLEIMRQQGKADALDLQNRSANMTGTELYAEDKLIPDFKEAVKVKNMMERKAGMTDGFVCKSSAGRVVRLLQNYDSDTYTAEPEELPAQWGFKWSTDPKKALPFVSIATSPYMKEDCCIWEGKIYKSKILNNIHSPTDYPMGWEEVEQ